MVHVTLAREQNVRRQENLLLYSHIVYSGESLCELIASFDDYCLDVREHINREHVWHLRAVRARVESTEQTFSSMRGSVNFLNQVLPFFSEVASPAESPFGTKCIMFDTKKRSLYMGYPQTCRIVYKCPSKLSKGSRCPP